MSGDQLLVSYWIKGLTPPQPVWTAQSALFSPASPRAKARKATRVAAVHVEVLEIHLRSLEP